MIISMKTARHFFALLPLSAAIAAAQTGGPATAVTPVVTVTVPQVQTTTPVVPATVRPLEPAVIVPLGTVSTIEGLGETSLTLDVTNGIRAVLPSRVTVPPGETVRVTGPASFGRTVQWSKNGAPIPGATNNPLTLANVSSSDAGTYTMITVDPLAIAVPSQTLILGVGPSNRLLNLSTRATVTGGAGDQGIVSGFVVGSGGRDKRLIIRAIGPSLSLFGLSGALRAPILRIFDSSGRPYENGYFYPAVVGGPTYESDLAESLARTGAFPIPSGTRDAVVMMPFAPGNYSAQVTSGDGTSGTVLLEIYEVP